MKIEVNKGCIKIKTKKDVFGIGIRSDTKRWRRYITPKSYMLPYHPYFKYYYRWFNIFWCKSRRCDSCGNYIGSRGGTVVHSDLNYDIKPLVICVECEKNLKYVDKKGDEYTGYLAWLRKLEDENE